MLTYFSVKKVLPGGVSPHTHVFPLFLLLSHHYSVRYIFSKKKKDIFLECLISPHFGFIYVGREKKENKVKTYLHNVHNNFFCWEFQCGHVTLNFIL